MTQKQALKTLKRIQNDPSLTDQFTEDEIEQLEYEASKKA